MPELDPGARHFAEGRYFPPHEFCDGNGNQNNNASHREIGVSVPDGKGVFTFENLSESFAGTR